MLDRTGDYSGSRWRGRVVNVMDPFKQGRIQVRLFNFHDNVAMIPDSDLPWAQPKVPLTHGASLKGVGASPVGVVPGSIVEGYFADSERSILIADGTLPSAGSTKYGQVVDGSYAIDPGTNDLALATREQDLNSALGGKNLTAIAAAGLKFASLSAGVGVLSSIPSNLTSTLLTLDPSNMSGALSGALTGISKLQAIDAFSSVSGLASIGTSGITRVLATSMSQFGVENTLAAVNAINPTSLSESALSATNGALQNISSTFQSGIPNPLSTLSAPSFNPDSLSFPSDSPHYASSQSLVSQLSSVASITDFGSLGGIDSVAAVPGGIGLTQSLLSDVAAGSLISTLSSNLLSGGGLVFGLNTLMSAVQLGGINMLFGASITSLDQLISLAPSIVPGLSSLTSVLPGISSINSLLSDFGTVLQAPNIIDTLLSSMLSSLKMNAGALASKQTSPPLPEPSTTTDSVATTTPAPMPSTPPTPQVGSADASAFQQANMEPASSSTNLETQLAINETEQPDPTAENSNIMNTIIGEQNPAQNSINVNNEYITPYGTSQTLVFQ